MKIKNKGKVYPSPSSSASSPERDALSVLKLLPAAILALATLLSLEDREVLAYLITRSLKTTTNHSSSIQDSNKKKSSKKQPPTNTAATAAHKPPVFECDCFDCYTSYWVRWDSSPNRELINQAIEAFEDHLANGEQSKKTVRGKRRDKTGRRTMINEKPIDVPAPSPPEISPSEVADVISNDGVLPPPPVTSPERSDLGEWVEAEESKEVIGEIPEVVVAAAEAEAEAEEEVRMVVRRTAENSTHKGLARKVLPDVLGLFNSRLWNLWSPNV